MAFGARARWRRRSSSWPESSSGQSRLLSEVREQLYLVKANEVVGAFGVNLGSLCGRAKSAVLDSMNTQRRAITAKSPTAM